MQKTSSRLYFCDKTTDIKADRLRETDCIAEDDAFKLKDDGICSGASLVKIIAYFRVTFFSCDGE